MAALTALALGLGACGSGGAQRTTSASSGVKPGTGRPPVLIGAKNFTEQRLLGELYTQALRARGYAATLRQDIPSTKLIHRALASGQIDGYPEYTGELLSVVARITRPQPSARAAHDTARAFERRQGLTVLDRTPFSDGDAVAVKPGFAREHKLKEIGDLERLGAVTLGGPRDFGTQPDGFAALKRAYAIDGVVFKPLSIGLQYAALDKGKILAADVSSTDNRLRTGSYSLLEDPKHILGFEHVVPIFSQRVISAEGPDLARTINAVSATLTTGAVQKLNAAVDVDKDSPAEAAGKFLRAHGLR